MIKIILFLSGRLTIRDSLREMVRDTCGRECLDTYFEQNFSTKSLEKDLFSCKMSRRIYVGAMSQNVTLGSKRV